MNRQKPAISKTIVNCRICGEKAAEKHFPKQGSQDVERDSFLITMGRSKKGYFGNWNLSHKPCICNRCFFTTNEFKIKFKNEIRFPRLLKDIEVNLREQRINLIRSLIKENTKPLDLIQSDIPLRLVKNAVLSHDVLDRENLETVATYLYDYYTTGHVLSNLSPFIVNEDDFEYKCVQAFFDIPRINPVTHILFVLDRLSLGRHLFYELIGYKWSPDGSACHEYSEKEIEGLKILNNDNFDNVLFKMLDIINENLSNEMNFKIAFNYIQDAFLVPNKKYIYLGKALQYLEHSYRIDGFHQLDHENLGVYKVMYLIVLICKNFGKHDKAEKYATILRKAIYEDEVVEYNRPFYDLAQELLKNI